MNTNTKSLTNLALYKVILQDTGPHSTVSFTFVWSLTKIEERTERNT